MYTTILRRLSRDRDLLVVVLVEDLLGDVSALGSMSMTRRRFEYVVGPVCSLITRKPDASETYVPKRTKQPWLQNSS